MPNSQTVVVDYPSQKYPLQNTNLKSLFSLWVSLQDTLDMYRDAESLTAVTQSVREKKLNAIVDAQSIVVTAVCRFRSESFEDLLYKVAIWKSDASVFKISINHADRRNLITKSVFADLLRLTGRYEVKSQIKG